MPEAAEPPSPPESPADLVTRIRATPGLATLVVEAVQTWQARAGSAEGDDQLPGWRAFSDAFPTFWEFSNRPR